MDTATRQAGRQAGMLCLHPPPLPGARTLPLHRGKEAWGIQNHPEPSRAKEPGDSRKPKTTNACFQTTLLCCLVGKLINYLESNISLFASEKGSASLIEPGFET